MKYHEEGFSLLELVLVFLVLSALILGGVGQYYHYKNNKSLEAVKHNITILMDAANSFYRYQCKNVQIPFRDRFNLDSFNIHVVKTHFPFQLFESGLINSVESKFQHGGYEILIETLGEPTYWPKNSNKSHAKVIFFSHRLKLKVSLASDVTDQWIEKYQNWLGALKIEGRKLVWEYLPGAAREKIKNPAWLTEAGMKQFRKKAIENFILEGHHEGPSLECAQ